MIIQLDKDFTIQDAEDEVSIFYPYLKMHLEFVKDKSEVRYPRTLEINSEMRMNNLQKLFVDELNIFPTSSEEQVRNGF